LNNYRLNTGGMESATKKARNRLLQQNRDQCGRALRVTDSPVVAKVIDDDAAGLPQTASKYRPQLLPPANQPGLILSKSIRAIERLHRVLHNIPTRKPTALLT
jgi:hypothetical protein